VPHSNSRQKSSSINWNSILDTRQLKLRINASCSQQSRISDYFEFVNKLDAEIFLLKENKFLRSKIQEMEKKFASLNQENPLEVAGQSLLTRMMRQAVKKFGKKPKWLRHDDVVLEHFCINVWILGGRRIYEIFYSNFIGIFPSSSTIQDRLRTFYLRSQDGINFSAVVEYLKTNNTPSIVVLSVDATGVLGCVDYHEKLTHWLVFQLH
jgi:hypothetical protein